MNSKSIATLIFALMIFLVPQLSEAANEKLYISVQSSKVRSQPSFLASSVSTVRYGDALRSIEKNGAWVKVSLAGGKVGYVHESALTNKPVSLSGGKGNTSVAQSDVVMAGKGFNSDVEKSYAASNQGLNFRGVDEMQRYSVPETELSRFIRDGRLQQRG